MRILQHSFSLPQFTNAFLDPQEDTTAAPYLEPTGAYSTLQPKDEDYEQLGILTERNLVDFARQIAAGMVSVTQHIKLAFTC